MRKLIEPDLLARFDRLVASRGTGLARAENQQCTGCRMGVRPQTWNQLREGELLTCDSCSRLLYWDPAMAPAPKSAAARVRRQLRAARHPQAAARELMTPLRSHIHDALSFRGQLESRTTLLLPSASKLLPCKGKPICLRS